MVGGEVIEVVPAGSKLWINCQEVTKERGTILYKTVCAIYVERNEVSEKIRPGDRLWWQGDTALWTPQENTTNRKNRVLERCGIDFDIQVRKIGNSGAFHPAQRMIEKAYENE